MGRDDLVRAVIESPWSIDARVAFAGWGVENHDPQGELTWLQLSEARERRSGTYQAAARAATAASALIKQHYAAWVRDVLRVANSPWFARGFVESVSVDAPTFLERADELFALAPIRDIQLVDAAADIEAIAASPHLARLGSLHFYNRSGASALGDAGLRTLLASPYLSRISLLYLSGNQITSVGVEALASQWQKMPNLIDVGLGNNPVENPKESTPTDPTTLDMVHTDITLPPFGEQLEATYGTLPWLHGPSRFLNHYPPSINDV